MEHESKTSRKSHRALATMVGSLLLGTLLAVGHHMYYASMNGHPVGQSRLQQETYVAAGVAFTFLVRAFILLAVGIAFTQLFWHDLLTQTSSIKTVDGLFTIRRNPLGLLDVRPAALFSKHRALLVTALVMWTIPFAMIFPPAALTIRASSTPYPSNTTALVPTINFNNSLFAQVYTPYRYPANSSVYYIGNTTYTGPQANLKSVFVEAAVSGSILDIPPPVLSARNLTYSMQFAAPALRCESGPQSLIDAVEEAMDVHAGGASTLGYGGEGLEFPLYIGWSPSATLLVPWDNIGAVNTTAGSFADETVSFFVGWSTSTSTAFAEFDHIVNCSLWNSTYSVDFSYMNGIQNISVSTSNFVPFGGVFSLISTSTSTQQYELPVLETFHNQSSVSYLALMDSFVSVLGGAVYEQKDLLAAGTMVKSTSSVLSTNLMETTNLSYVGSLYSFQNTEDVGGPSADPGPPLADALEQLFVNATLSLLRDLVFTVNGTDNYGITQTHATTNVTITIYTTENEYAYAPIRLVAAYAACIGVAACCVGLGCFAIFSNNGMSYSENFSSVFRFTYGAEIDITVAGHDRYGNDPLPKYIAEAKIFFEAPSGATSLTSTGRDREAHSAWTSASLLVAQDDDAGEALPLRRLHSLEVQR